MSRSGKITLHSIHGIPVNRPFIMCYHSEGQPSVDSKVYMIIEYSGKPLTEPIKVNVKGSAAADEKNEASDEKYLQELNRIFNCDDILNVKTVSDDKMSLESNSEILNNGHNSVNFEQTEGTIYKCGEKGISGLQRRFKRKVQDKADDLEKECARKGKKRVNDHDLDDEDIFLKNLYNMSEIAPKRGKTVTLTEEEINSGRQINVDGESDDEHIQENTNNNEANGDDPRWTFSSREVKREPVDDDYNDVNSSNQNEFTELISYPETAEKHVKIVEGSDELETAFKEALNAMDEDSTRRSCSNTSKLNVISNYSGNLFKTKICKVSVNKLFESKFDYESERDRYIKANQIRKPGSFDTYLTAENRQLKPDANLTAVSEGLGANTKRVSRRLSNQKERNINPFNDSNFQTEDGIDGFDQDCKDETDTGYLESTDEEMDNVSNKDPDYAPRSTKDKKRLSNSDEHDGWKTDRKRQNCKTPKVSKKVWKIPRTENVSTPGGPKAQAVNKMEQNLATGSFSVAVDSESFNATKKEPRQPEVPKRISVKLEDYQDKYYLEDLVSIHIMDRRKSDSEKTVKVMVCAECHRFKTEDQTQMEIHIEQHVNGELTCKTCQFIGKSLKEVFMHESAFHKKQTKNHTCFVCKESFKFLQDYQEHVTQVHNLLPWICNYCSTIEKPVMFDRRPGYREHYIEKHKDLLFQCVHCGLYFATKKGLRKHSCEFINQDRKTPCDICGKLLASAMSVRNHKNNVHFNIRSHPCSQCNYTAKSALVLKNHVQARHKGIRPYKCDQCNFSSVKSGQLVSHKRTHTGQKPYKCDKCPYAAAWNVQLKDHKKLHDSSLGHECMICSVVVRKGASYAKHMKKEHGFEEY